MLLTTDKGREVVGGVKVNVKTLVEVLEQELRTGNPELAWWTESPRTKAELGVKTKAGSHRPNPSRYPWNKIHSFVRITHRFYFGDNWNPFPSLNQACRQAQRVTAGGRTVEET